MLHQIKLFFSYVRLALFTWRLEWEIFQRIAPQIHQEKDCGYSFGSEEELLEAAASGELEARSRLQIIERQAGYMGKSYGEAFRYVMYRDLNSRLLLYVKLAQWRVPPKQRITKYA